MKSIINSKQAKGNNKDKKQKSMKLKTRKIGKER